MKTITHSFKPYPQINTLLKEFPLFDRLNNSQRSSLCETLNIYQLETGDILFTQGDPVNSFYFVYEGLIKLYRESNQGQEKIFELQKTGSIFAEALMLDESTQYPVNSAAMEKSIVIAIDALEFRKILHQSIDTCLLIMSDLSRRLHQLLNEVEHLSLLSTRNRVAAYLLNEYIQNNKEPFKLSAPKNIIASILSLQPETFSRLLKELNLSGGIKCKGSLISISDEYIVKQFAGIV